MSEKPTFTTGEASVQADHGYEPLPDTRPKEEDTSGHYGPDERGLRHAAQDLGTQR
jgi:hypothetical protein